MKNQMGNSRMDTILKMLLIAFISLLAFSSGVYFGKQMSDSDYQLKALESDFNNSHSTASHEAKSDGIMDDDVAALSEKLIHDEKDDLAEVALNKNHGKDHENSGHHESNENREVASTHAQEHGSMTSGHSTSNTELKSNHGEENMESNETHSMTASHGASPHQEMPDTGDESTTSHSAQHEVASSHGIQKEGHESKKPDLSAAHMAANRVANNSVPVDPPKPIAVSRVPTSLPRTVGANTDVEFTVQVASYPSAATAKEHAENLIKKGFPAFPVEAKVNGRTWYRVSVGSFRTLKEATSYRAQLLRDAEIKSAIVQKIQR